MVIFSGVTNSATSGNVPPNIQMTCESFAKHISNSTFPVSQNVKKKAISGAALSLCYPVNEKVPRLRR
jgi:hypothetical protein